MATRASRIALAGSNISSTGEVDADLLDNTDSAAFLSLNGSGFLGIGTSQPDLTLHVDGANGYPATSGTSPVGHIAIRAKNESSTHGATIGVADAAPWGTWIQAQDAGNLANSYPILLNPNGGNVGIGTSSPNNKLEVDGSIAFTKNGTSGNRWLLIDGADGTYAGTMNIQAGFGSNAAGGAIKLYAHQHATYPGSTWIGRSAGSAGNIMFGNGGTGPSSASQIQMVINSSGNVGIGTSSPSQIFHVQKAADDKLVYGSNPRLLLDTPTGINGLRVLGDTTPFEFKIDSGTYNGSTFQMGGTGDLSFIGTTTTASDTFNDSPTFFFNSQRWNGSANSTHFQGAIKGHTRSATNGDGYLGIGANASANHINIDASTGNVGIGTTSPDTLLHLHSSVGDTILTLEADSDDNVEHDNPQIHFLTDGGLRTAAITGGNATNEGSGHNHNALNLQSQTIRFLNSSSQDFDLASESMRIDSAGYVQIGNTQASHVGTSQLFINRALNAAPATSGTAQTGGALRLRGGDNAVLDMGLNSVNTWIQATDRANLANGYTLSLNPNGGTVGVGNSGASFTNQGMTYSNSWHEVVFGGTVTPTNAITVQVDIAGKSTGQIFKVEAIFNHWNSDNANYTVAKKVKYFWTYSSTTSIAEHNDGTTDRGGSSVGTWTVDKPSNTRLRVTKSAGSNAWPGEWYVRITSSCPITKV